MDSSSMFPRDISVLIALVLQNLIYVPVFILAYYVLVALYNISPLHPLYRFPGPRLASATYLYEAYYEWILTGKFTREIKRMHEEYGPIVRVNPGELHCCDPSFTPQIYPASAQRIRDRWQHQFNSAGDSIGFSAFGSIHHEQHRDRNKPLIRFFSRQQISLLQDEVKELAQATVDKFLRHVDQGPFDVKQAFSCFTADVISQYAFGEPMGFIAQQGWEPNFSTWTVPFFKLSYRMRHDVAFRTIVKLAQSVPFILPYLGKDMETIETQRNVIIPGYIEAARKNPQKGRVFTELLEAKDLPPSEKSTPRMAGEGFNLLVAGTETTAAVLTMITFHLLDKPTIYQRLKRDLGEDFDLRAVTWTDLEKLPYLWAVVHEGLRLMPGLSDRTSRIAREEKLVYHSQDGKYNYVVPEGTPMGMSAAINHWNEDLFPDPGTFSPERWLKEGEPDHNLARNLIAFSKGTRGCIGQNLAYSELYIMTALLVQQVVPYARLHETTVEDVQYDHDLLIPQTKHGSLAVHITMSTMS